MNRIRRNVLAALVAVAAATALPATADAQFQRMRLAVGSFLVGGARGATTVGAACVDFTRSTPMRGNVYGGHAGDVHVTRLSTGESRPLAEATDWVEVRGSGSYRTVEFASRIPGEGFRVDVRRSTILAGDAADAAAGARRARLGRAAHRILDTFQGELEAAASPGSALLARWRDDNSTLIWQIDAAKAGAREARARVDQFRSSIAALPEAHRWVELQILNGGEFSAEQALAARRAFGVSAHDARPLTAAMASELSSLAADRDLLGRAFGDEFAGHFVDRAHAAYATRRRAVEDAEAFAVARAEARQEIVGLAVHRGREVGDAIIHSTDPGGLAQLLRGEVLSGDQLSVLRTMTGTDFQPRGQVPTNTIVVSFDGDHAYVSRAGNRVAVDATTEAAPDLSHDIVLVDGGAETRAMRTWFARTRATTVYTPQSFAQRLGRRGAVNYILVGSDDPARAGTIFGVSDSREITAAVGVAADARTRLGAQIVDSREALEAAVTAARNGGRMPVVLAHNVDGVVQLPNGLLHLSRISGEPVIVSCSTVGHVEGMMTTTDLDVRHTIDALARVGRADQLETEFVAGFAREYAAVSPAPPPPAPPPGGGTGGTGGRGGGSGGGGRGDVIGALIVGGVFMLLSATAFMLGDDDDDEEQQR